MSPGRTAMPGREPGVFIAITLDGARFDVGFENGRPFVVRSVTACGLGRTWWRLDTLEPGSAYARAALAADAWIARFRLPAVAS
jgi:hypothetical protein